MNEDLLVADCETDGFLTAMTRIWMLQIGTAGGDDVEIYADQPGFKPLTEGIARLKSAKKVVFHNGHRFDFFAINKIFPGTLQVDQIVDTLILARLLFPEERQHSLKEWGLRLKAHKGDYTGDFSEFTQEMVEYGRQDIVVGRKLYHHLMKAAEGWDWSAAIETEHKFAHIIALQEQNGFLLNQDKAISLAAELRQEQHDLTKQLQEVFQPIVTERFSEKTGKRLKDGVEVFNPGSGQQIAKRLKEKYGWRARKFTPTGIAATDESVLGALPYPEAKLMVRYLNVQKMLGQIEDGKNGWLKLVNSETSRVHGAVNTLGAATGRCSHFYPNMAQVSKKDLRMREVWEAKHGWKLVGVDAEGLEFRMLAHYMAHLDGGKTTDTVLNGDKAKKTDIHSLNQQACGFYLRDSAKTAIYALIYGAGDPKLGKTVVDDAREAGKPKPVGNLQDLGRRVRASLGKGTPGLDKLIAGVSTTAKARGWLKGIDGRKIKVNSPHSAFNYLLQGGGAILMKVALVIFYFERIPKLGWQHGVDFAFCANVHDEAQSEVRPEIAEQFGQELADCIREAGERLGCRCQMAGSYDIGDNWRETH